MCIFESFGENALKQFIESVCQLIPLDVSKQANQPLLVFADAIRKLSWSGIPVTVRPTTWQLLCVSHQPLIISCVHQAIDITCDHETIVVVLSLSLCSVISLPTNNLFEIQPEIFGFDLGLCKTIALCVLSFISETFRNSTDNPEL